MSADDAASKLVTPRHTIRMQALSSFFRTPTTVSRRNKRTHGQTMTTTSSTPATPSTPLLPAIVLQTYSLSTDSIVLTALPSVPFCCHEDLLTMSRAQLEGVARSLNARLPHRMRIGPDDFWQDGDQDRARHSGEGDIDEDDGLSRMSEAEIRKRIEELVGIRAIVGKNRVSRSGLGLGTRARVPPAPKAVKTRDAEWKLYETTPWEMELDTAADQSDDMSAMIEDALMGSSPLASRTKLGAHSRTRLSGVSPRLAILQEENEGCESKEDPGDEARPSKRQRVTLGPITQHLEEESQNTQGVNVFRLIENMDVSGSALLAREEDASSDNLMVSDERLVTATTIHEDASETPKEDVQAPLKRRRSARIQGLELKRAPLVMTGNKTASDPRDSKPFTLRSKPLSSRRKRPETKISDADENSGIPREVTLCLPFASTPPQEKLDSSAWVAPRILRSHSQRLTKSSQSTKMKSSLGRSLSERSPRAQDFTFVTLNRPRYRFDRRKSRETNVTKENYPSTSNSPAHGADQLQQAGEKPEHEKENEDPHVATRNPAADDVPTLPSPLCSFLTTRSRAPSTSTIASTRGTNGDSPARLGVREVTAPNVILETIVGDGTTDRVWETLGRMVVDSL